MIYEFPILIDPDTQQADATKTTVKLAPGTITLLGIEFPSGCAGLVAVAIYEKTVRLFPTNNEYPFRSDDQYLVFNPNYELTKSPHILTIRAWNEDVRYPHTPIVRFEIIEKGRTLVDRLVRLLMGGGV